MANGDHRLDRIENILEEVAARLRDVAAKQDEMAARQQYHDEAFERQDAEIKALREAQAIDGEYIRAMVRIAEIRHERLNG